MKCIKTTALLLIIGLSQSVFAAESDLWQVQRAELRPPLPGQTTAVVYLRLKNRSAQPHTLIGVSAPWASRIEIHEHQHSDGMMRMRQLPELVIAAGAWVNFKSGAHHLMAFDFDDRLFQASPSLDLQFGRDSTVNVVLTVRPH